MEPAELRSARPLLRHPLGLIALGFGTGLVPLMPGTVASLAAWAVWRCALLLDFRLPLALFALFVLLAMAAVRYAEERLGRDDPRVVVVDEWLGMWLALALVPPGLATEALAFVLFRLFDALKPGPLARLERLPGALGVIADDLAAGLLAAATVAVMAWSVAMLQGS